VTPARRAKKPPFLTRAESEVMRVLWDKEGATVHEVMAELPKPLAYTTVLTLLRILVDKGYATPQPHPEGGRAHLYRPAVPASQARRTHLRDLVDRLFGGDPRELMIGLLDEDSLSRTDLEALQKRIHEQLRQRPKLEKGR
jgi:predicted transcriptional regulator